MVTAGDLAALLAGRAATAGRTDASIAVAAAALAAGDPGVLAAGLVLLDAECAARTPSPALRRAARAQGRGLLRTARRSWPSGLLDSLGGVHPEGPFHAVALGVVGAVAGLGRVEVAAAALWSALSGPAWAAVRLLGLDPLDVAALLAGLGPVIDTESDRAAATTVDAADLPALGAPLTEIGAQAHATWEVRLFAS